MSRALAGLARFPSPIGPVVDVDEHVRAEVAWLASLSEADALELLAWAGEPTPLEGWAERWTLHLRRHAIEYAAEVYARYRSSVIRDALARLAQHPELRDVITDVLEE